MKWLLRNQGRQPEWSRLGREVSDEVEVENLDTETFEEFTKR